MFAVSREVDLCMIAKLVIGNFGMSDDQERVYIAMWAMWSAPLIMSNDLRSVKRSSKRLLLNKNVIRINQDELGVQARMIIEVRRPMTLFSYSRISAHA